MEKLTDLIKKELGLEKAKITEEDKTKGVTSIANITMEQVVKFAKDRKELLSSKDFKSCVKQVVGTISSMQGITIEEKTPKEIIQEIDEGKWDSLIK